MEEHAFGNLWSTLHFQEKVRWATLWLRIEFESLQGCMAQKYSCVLITEVSAVEPSSRVCHRPPYSQIPQLTWSTATSASSKFAESSPAKVRTFPHT
jgi:hypothetical protein